MTPPTLVIAGDIVLEASAAGVARAAAIGIADGRVVVAGGRADVLGAAPADVRLLDMGSAAIIPGLHDSHIHLVGLARSRLALLLDDARSGDALLAAVHAAANGPSTDGWLRGRGWRGHAMNAAVAGLAAITGARPAFLTAHDGHSAWASPEALQRAGVIGSTLDPPGGRIERDSHGQPSGILRETAMQLVASVVPQVGIAETTGALRRAVAELHAWGVTGVTDAGDDTAAGGNGAYAALGDTLSTVAALAADLDGQLRLTVNLPHRAIAAAVRMGLRTGSPLAGASTLRIGWAKLYADGALGSRTAALFAPYAGAGGGSGLLRLGRDAILDAAGMAVPGGIALAIHAIGDRAAATVLDAFEAMAPLTTAIPPHRLEHAQLLRAQDRSRLRAANLTVSMQPIHAVADRDLADAAWADRLADAYAWRSIAAAGGRLAFGSDAPVESPNPWLGLFAAVRRRLPRDGRRAWTVGEAIDLPTALGAYSAGAGAAASRADEGHLRPGARADLAVLNVDLATILAADDRLAEVRALLTLVSGREVHRA